jgi:pterin-4a-carbinolamine dehydratase
MKLNELMGGYLGEETKERNPLQDIMPSNLIHEQVELPVEVIESKWDIKESPECLVRTFQFKNLATRNWFLAEILENEKSTLHYGKITVEGKDVKVEVQTHDLNKVTELDQEYAAYCDDVWEDVDFIGGRQ